MNASTVAHWITVMRAADEMRFTRVVPWDRNGLWFCEFAAPTSGRLHRDLILDGDTVRTAPDEDV